MLPGVDPAGVPSWRTEVTVNGVVRAHQSVDWVTEMRGDLPDQVVASGGMGGASGTIVWAAQKAVTDRPVSPWGKATGWPPSAGDTVRVRVTDGTTWWTRYTGVIDKTTGDPTTGFQSRIIDHRDQLTGTFTHEALLRHMTPLFEDGAYRSVGLDHWYPLVMALRSCGFYNVPAVEGPSAVSVPFQGSVWPEAGTVRDAQGPVLGTHASFPWAEYGYAAANFSATYLPRLTEPSTTPLQVTLGIPSPHAGTAVTNIVYSSGATVRMYVNTGRGVTAYYSPDGAVPWTTVAQLSMNAASQYITLLIKGGSWQMRTDSGQSVKGTQALGSGTMSSVAIDADAAARVCTLQVSHPNSSTREFASLSFVPNMRFSPSGLASSMDMMPALRKRSIPELVDEILAATLTAAWWDEEGRLVLKPSDLLRSGAPVQTVTTRDDITQMAWEDSLLSVRSGVDVEWKSPLVSKTFQHRLELWRGRTQTLLSTSDPIEDFVTPESGVEWFGVDRTLRLLNESNWGAYNLRRGSYCGVWYSNADGDPTTAGDVSVTSENLYADSMKVTTRVVSLVSSYEANTETHPEAVALKPYLRGQSLPVVRGMGRGEWVDETYSATAGTVGSILSHDLGYWGGEFFEGGSVAQRIGDFLAGMVTAPHPTITDLGLVYDPRRQLGDVVTISSTWLGIELDVLIVRLSEAHDGASSQAVQVRVIRATSTRPVTYDDLAAAWSTGNYTSLQTAWQALTYTDLAADPLEGAP